MKNFTSILLFEKHTYFFEGKTEKFSAIMPWLKNHTTVLYFII